MKYLMKARSNSHAHVIEFVMGHVQQHRV